MTDDTTRTEGPSPLDNLASRIEGEQRADAPQLSPDQAQAEAEGKAAFDKMMAGLGVFADKALKAVRAGIARRLPEIREHWTDADLAGFSEALPPVAAKWLGRLGPLMGAYPEECMLLLAAAPLVAGYVGAVSDHNEATAKVIEAPPAAAPAAGAPAAAPASGTPIYRVG